MQHFPTIGKVLFFFSDFSPFFLSEIQDPTSENIRCGVLLIRLYTLLQKPVSQGESDKFTASTAV